MACYCMGNGENKNVVATESELRVSRDVFVPLGLSESPPMLEPKAEIRLLLLPATASLMLQIESNTLFSTGCPC